MAPLLRRAGVGPAPGEVKARLETGEGKSVVELVEFHGMDDGLAELDHLVGGLLDFKRNEDVRTGWVYRLRVAPPPVLGQVPVLGLLRAPA